MNKNSSAPFLNVVSWQTVEIVPLRRAGRWLVGVAVQENDEGRRRLKIFKGRIKDDGRYEVLYKGKRVRFSLSQRLNIPSQRYWEWLKSEVDPLVRKYLSVESKEEEKHGKQGPTILDFAGMD